jgi:putative transcriptional regulator
MINDVAALRRELGLTQECLAGHAQISRQSIISIEKGRFDPSLKVAFRISQALGRSIEDVFHADPG